MVHILHLKPKLFVIYNLKGVAKLVLKNVKVRRMQEDSPFCYFKE